MPSVTQQRTISEVIRSLSGMDSPDYIDLFTVTTNEAADALPERWSRTAIEDVAGLGGQFIWRGVLGLRLKSRRSTERVGGWKIADRGEDWIRLEASSWFLTAHLVIRLDDEHLSIGTFIRYDRPIAALIWVPVSAVRRRLMPGLLRQTVRLQVQRNHDPAASPMSRGVRPVRKPCCLVGALQPNRPVERPRRTMSVGVDVGDRGAHRQR